MAYDTVGNYLGESWQPVNVKGLGGINIYPQQVCPGEEVIFNLNGNAEWVIWKLPDGDTIREWDAKYNFPTAGTFTVKALANTWECGIDSVSVDVNVTVGAKPLAEIWMNGDWYCPNDEIKFDAPEAFSHKWIINNDTILEKTIYYAFPDTGEYLIKLIAFNGCGNSDTATRVVIINTESFPDASFYYNYEGANCPHNRISFEANGTGKYEWDFGDGSFAYDRIVYNAYSDTGQYNVRLIVRNGCGFADTSYQYLYVQYNPDYMPWAYIRFKDKENYIDTLRVCPGTEVAVESETSGEDVKFSWFVDGNTFTSENLIYSFSSPGLKEIQFIASNTCGGADTAYKYVQVDDQMPPMFTVLSSAPQEICPGEEVYFWDEGKNDSWSTDYIQKLIYEIDFGDGQNISGITTPTVQFPPVLAKHQYTVADTFHYIFTARNTCGIKDTLQGDIIVSDDPDRQPFYYVGNSTSEKEEGKMEDWSMPVPNGHEFIIPVNLMSWGYLGPMDSTVYIFIWYGDLRPGEEDPGPPHGVVQVKAPDTVSVYVPFNVIKPSVGLGVVWYCDPGNFDQEPQLYTLPMNQSMEMINSFPIEKNGFTDLTTLPEILGPLTLDGMMYPGGSCITNTNDLKGEWFYQADLGYYVKLEIWEQNGDSLTYNLRYGSDKWNTPSFVSSGTIMQMNDSMLYFLPMSDQNCQFNFEYIFRINETTGQLTFEILSDDCSSRSGFFTSKPFSKEEYNYDYDSESDRTGCPGDNIELYVAGGLTYEWRLTDGTTSNLAHFYHVYDTAGVYEELLVATNACDRVDSIITTVIIDTTNVPDAHFYTNKWDIRRMEPIQFFPENKNGDDFGNNTYFWDFGDGNTSTLKTPVHYYTYEGQYEVTLIVTNGCGSSSYSWSLWVNREISNCTAKFTFELNDSTVVFKNNSIGEITSYLWDFGDGKKSTLKDPTYKYQKPGVYQVTLFVRDSLTQCSDEVSIMIKIGSIDCFADYTYIINETSQTVIFKDESLGDINSWYWNFGDGTFSTDTFPTHQFRSTGIYIVCLTVSNNTTGSISKICKEIRIGAVDLYADFKYFIDPVTGVVNFSDNSEGNITNWYWEYGDGTWDTIPYTTHTYSEPGLYYVCLGIYNKYSDAFDNYCQEIAVGGIDSVITQAKFDYIVYPVTRTVKFISNSVGNITNTYWTFGDGKYATGDSVVHQYATPGLYSICLTVYDASTNQRSQECVTIQVGTLTCNLNAEFGYIINPSTNEVSFSDKSLGTIQKWFWDFGDGITSTQKSPKHKFDKAGFYLVSLGIRDTTSNCTDYFAEFIQVGTADCKSNFDFTITNLATNTVKFTNTATGDIGTYFWYFNDGNYSTDVNPIHSYNSGGLYNVSLTVSDATGLCFDFIAKDVQVGTIDCNADFTYYIDSTSNEVYFTNEVIGESTSLYWLFGDGNFYIGQDPVHQYVAPGYYKVSLNTFNSGNGCMDYEEKIIMIGSPGGDVEADFVYTANLATREVKFSNQSRGEYLKYSWSFGDGTVSDDMNPTKIYNTGGYKFVCLTATDSLSVNKMQNTVCKMIQVSTEESTNCLAKFIYDVDTTENKVVFSDKSYGSPDIHMWDFGDGTKSTSKDPEKIYSQNGYYLVGLTTKNTTTGCESYEYHIVNVNGGDSSIQAMFTYKVDTTSGGKPGGKPVDMIGVGHGGGSSMSWSYGDGKQTNSKVINELTLRPTHVYENPGIYECCLIISDPIINQADTFCSFIPIPYEITANEAICQGSNYNFMGNLLTTAGDYVDTTTSLIGVDSIVYLTLTVNPVPAKPTVTLSGTTLTSSTGTTYQWYQNGIAIDGATNQTYTATATGNYTVKVTNSSGCESVASDAVTVTISGIEDMNPFSLKVFPNPLQTHTRIEYYLANTQQIKIALYDVAGNLMETIVNTYKPAGDQYIIWRNPGLANGIYYLVITSDTDKSTTKLVIQK